MKQILMEYWAALADAGIQALRPVGIVLGGTVFAALCAHVAIPLVFTPVPLTLAPFAVLLLGLLLTPQMAAVTFVAYLAEGAAGLPVFVPSSAMPAGFAHLLCPTGGYLMAYPLAAVLIAWLWRGLGQRFGRTFGVALTCAAIGDALILACGALWFSALPHVAAVSALTVLPFLPGDALKVAAAAGLGAGWVRLRRQKQDSHPS